MVFVRDIAPVLFGYAASCAAIGLLVYTAACSPKPEEQWNSYYYGTSASYDRGIKYYRNTDADDNYVMPNDIRRPMEDRSHWDRSVNQFDLYSNGK